jgi:hypothetical protein
VEGLVGEQPALPPSGLRAHPPPTCVDHDGGRHDISFRRRRRRGRAATSFDAAPGQDVRLGGGVATIQQYLRAGLIDELHLAIVPVLLGAGERLFDNLDGPAGYEPVELTCSPSVAHVRLARAQQ